MRRSKHIKKLPDGRPTKYIRINDKTLIEVDFEADPQTARERFLRKFATNAPAPRQYGRDETYYIKEF